MLLMFLAAFCQFYTLLFQNRIHPPHKITGLPGHAHCRETHHSQKGAERMLAVVKGGFVFYSMEVPLYSHYAICLT